LFDPGSFAALIFAFVDDRFATDILFKTAFVFSRHRLSVSRERASPLP